MVTEEKVLRTARVFVPGPVQTRACRQGLEGDGVERIELELETHGREVPADTETRLLYGLSDNLTSDTPNTPIGYLLLRLNRRTFQKTRNLEMPNEYL